MSPANPSAPTANDKLEARLKEWTSPEGKPIETAKAKEDYRARAQRFADVVRLKQPDRVPVFCTCGGFVATYAGVSHADMFYDYDKAVKALNKMHEDFDLDYQVASNFLPGKVYDRLGYQIYRWPGGALPKEVPFQCVEAEYMKADEYDALAADPEGFCMRVYMPRVFSALTGFQFLPTFFGSTEIPLVPFMLAPVGLVPPVREAFQAYLDAGEEVAKWLAASGQAAALALGKKGLPATAGGFTKAPFDFVGDTLRGTKGVMLDMYRQPGKLLAALDRLVPMAIEMAVSSANASKNPFMLIPLHKGADGFMSDANFRKFYWPTLKATLLGMIEEGVVPFLFVEGGYNQRLDAIAESGLPPGTTVWMFDHTDMAAAKKKFGSWACIGGNVPVSLFKAGTPKDMDEAVKKLMDIAAPGGGYFVTPGAVLDDASVENVRAYLDAAHKHGAY